MIKVKDGYAKLIGTTYQGSATQVLLSNGGDLEYSASSKASTLVQRNASQHIYATYFNSAISDEALTDIGSVYVRNTSDTFIRRVSKTQFYSILDDKFVTLDTTQSITGAKTFSTSVRFANNASIIQNQNDTSNYTTILKWYKNGASRNTYDPSIGQHNTGGDGNGSICILPYPTETSPWGGMVGLFISKGVLKLDGKSVALAENYYTKTESDERYVNVTGDTMTGPLIVKAAITGTQLISTIATGTSPLKVTSTTVVTNLNSDLLDGLHETSFFRARGDQSIASSVPTTTELATSNNLCGSWNVKYTGASGHLVQFNAGSGSTRYMQFYSMYSGSLYWRNSTDSTLNTKSWKKILDSSNYTAYINPANFVTALGTSGNYLTWTKNGVVNNLTVPYATASSRINSSSSVQNTGLTYYSSGGFVVGGTAAGGQWGMPSDSQDAAYKNGQCLRMYWGSTYYTDILSGPNNMGTTHGLYMRQIVNGAVATGTFAGGWRLILDSYNYHRYGDTRYVTSLGTNGTYVTWVKNGTTNNLTVPYSSYSGYLQSHDTRSTNNTPAQFSSGARFEFKYNSTDGLSNGGTYHGILHFKPYGGTTDFSGGQTHQLGFTDGGNLYMRTSTSSSAWGSWKLILTQTTADGRYVTSLGTNGNYLTWTKAGTTNNITVPYATNSNKANYIYYGSISNLNSPSSWTSDGYRLVYDTYSGSASNKPVSQDNANGIITLFKSKHGTSNQYVSQLAFPNNTRMYFRYASAGSFSSWYTIAYTSDIKDPANYYWANVKVSASSNSGTSPTFNTCYTSNWFRSTGNTGWYSESYGGGWYMTDSTWIRTYGSKSVYQNTGQIRTDGYLVTNGGITVGATSPNNGTYKSHVTGNSWSSGYIRAGAGFYHNSVNSNNYVLLAGGSYKSLADFAKGNAGASNRGVYVTNGTVTAMTYYLNATINSGASGKLAYYSGTNSIDDYTSTVGSSGTPIYLSSGVPTACTGVMVKYWASYTINNYSGTSVTYSKNGGNYNFVTSTSRRDTGRYTIGTVYPSGQTWYTTLVWAVGNLNASNSSNSSNSLLYCTLIRGYNSGSTYYWYVNTADDASTNNGSFGLFFLCF